MDAAMGPGPGEVTALPARLRAGESDALDRLLPVVYDELRQLARSHHAGRRGGGWQRTTLHDGVRLIEFRADEVLALDRALGQPDERQRRVVEYCFFGGLEEKEIAAVVGPLPRGAAEELRRTERGQLPSRPLLVPVRWNFAVLDAVSLHLAVPRTAPLELRRARHGQPPARLVQPTRQWSFAARCDAGRRVARCARHEPHAAGPHPNPAHDAVPQQGASGTRFLARLLTLFRRRSRPDRDLFSTPGRGQAVHSRGNLVRERWRKAGSAWIEIVTNGQAPVPSGVARACPERESAISRPGESSH